MSCLCSQLDAITKVESQPGLFGSLTANEYGNWVKLCRCKVCGQLWSIDECDKGNIAFAKKLSSESNWQVQNIEEQKAFLLKARGGTEKKFVLNPAVKISASKVLPSVLTITLQWGGESNAL